MEFPQGTGECLRELVLQRTVDQQIVRRNTGLPGVEGFAPGDAARGGRDVGPAVDDAGTFTAQFQYDGRQIPGRRGHDDSSQRRASREEDHVPAQVEQPGVHIPVALHDGDVLFVENFGDEPFDRLCDVGRIRRRFQQGGAAGRNGADQWVQQQLHGVVPRCDDERLPEGLTDDPAFRRQEFERRGARFGAHPFAEMAQVVADFTPDDADFGKIGLFGGFTQVCPQGVA